VVQLLVEKVVVHPNGAVEVHHVLPFEEPPVAADQKKKGTPGEFYHIPSNLVVKPCVLHNTLDISTCYPHGVS
jgi:hypothetical protein